MRWGDYGPYPRFRCGECMLPDKDCGCPEYMGRVSMTPKIGHKPDTNPPESELGNAIRREKTFGDQVERVEALARRADKLEHLLSAVECYLREGRGPMSDERITVGEYDVTEAVQVLFDLVVQSMDWGSGFLSREDVLPILDLAEITGFQREEIENYLIADAVMKRMNLWRGHNPRQEVRDGNFLRIATEWREREAEARRQFTDEERAALRAGHISDTSTPDSAPTGQD